MKLNQLLSTCIILSEIALARGTRHGWSGSSSNNAFEVLTAYTSNGPIVGHPSNLSSNVVEYLGIPYAEPPLGPLRFAPAQPYKGSGRQIASIYGYDCPAPLNPPYKYPGLTPQAPRILANFQGQTGTTQDEDCLTLNVWRPRSQTGAGHKGWPMIVYFYGGRFTTGATNTPFLDGTLLAGRQDIIVVTVNFRSNIFGYPGTPGQTQNLGLRDQRLAVEWVARNARAFGGDADKIVLMGQSSGSVAVAYWPYAYVNDTIISGLISHSGNALSFPLAPSGTAARSWYNVSAQLGCGSSGDTLECMRSQSWQSILSASTKVPAISSGNPLRSTPAFNPVADNETVFTDYEARSTAGTFARVPYLLGNCDHEQAFYALLAYTRTGINTTAAQGNNLLMTSFTCPNFFEATNRRRYNVPVWLFRYFGDWDNLRLFPSSGAYHGSDVDVIFGNDAEVSGILPSAAEEQTTDLLQTAWAAFARDPWQGLLRLGYPSFNQRSDSLIRFAYDNDPAATFVSPLEYAAYCNASNIAGI